MTKKSDRIGTSLEGLLRDVALDASPRSPKARSPSAKTPRAKTPKAKTPEAKSPEAKSPSAEGRSVARPAEPPRPSAHLKGDDRIAFYDAIAGVRPLGAGGGERRKKKARPRVSRPMATSPSEDAARARLASLVAEGVRFEIETDDPDEVPEWEEKYLRAIERLTARLDEASALLGG